MCRQVEVPEMGRLLVHRSPTECCVCECDLKTSVMRSPRATWAVEPLGGGNLIMDENRHTVWKIPEITM